MHLKLSGVLVVWVCAFNTPAHGHVFQSSQTLPLYRQECAACHVAYPPALLPAQSWQRIMQGLSDHYGVDASLDADQIQHIAQWLQGQAGSYRKVHGVPAQDRITQSDWFVRKHRKVTREVWRLPSVQGPTQCAACHAQAEQGRFDEHDLRRPAGMKGDFR